MALASLPDSISTSERSLSCSWAGGENGMKVLGQVLERLPYWLSSKGCFYCVVIQENNPKKIIEDMATLGFSFDILMKRKSGIELLYVLRFRRK